jgi:hypothetical protein
MPLDHSGVVLIQLPFLFCIYACEFNYINKLKINKYQNLSSKFQRLLVLEGASVQMEIGHFGIPVGSNSVGVPE